MSYSSTMTPATSGALPQLDTETPPIDMTQQMNCLYGEVQAYASLAIKYDDIGKPSQPRCSEMLHWDDFRTMNNLNDGTPQMMQCFATPGGGQVPPMPFTEGSNRVVYASVSVDPCLAGSSHQPFCTEMVHWDDACDAADSAGPSSSTTAPTPARMRTLFKPVRGEQRWFLQDGKLSCELSIAWFSDAGAPISSDMLHWTDCQATAPKAAAATKGFA